MNVWVELIELSRLGEECVTEVVYKNNDPKIYLP